MTLRVFASALLAAGSVCGATFDIPLPTPIEHYQTYKVDEASLSLMGKVMNELDPALRAQVMQFMAGGEPSEVAAKVDTDEALKMVRALGLEKYKSELLEVLLHQSQVLDVLPPESREKLLPVVHDALLAFMDGLSEERLADRLAVMLRMPQNATRGDKILVLASKIPTLQKVGQVIARFDGVPPDIRAALITLENAISTMSRDEMVAYIEQDVGKAKIEEYQIHFADKLLAEASVGAVIRGTWATPGASEPREMVCKVVKPYARTGLPQEMVIIDGLIDLADKNAAFYHVEGINLRDFFTDIRDKLQDEIKITEEQGHFKLAHAYYGGMQGVVVPEVYPFSTENVTFMDFLHVKKVTEAFPGDQKRRSELARRLLDLMSFDPLFSRQEVSIFHGDPHAGNVMHIYDEPKDPYKIALLDWGLMGEFPKEQRTELVQLSLALQSRNKSRLMKNVGALLRGGMPEDTQKVEQIRALLDQTLAGGEKGTFATFQALLEKLFEAGYSLDPNMSLFIKSQVTLAGIFKELDPALDQDKMLKSKVSKQVLKELPRRILFFPAWHYRGYRSLLSNGDVFSYMFH